MNNKIEIQLNVPLTDDILFYIADCWIRFVTEDLGYRPCDLCILLPLNAK